MGIRKKQITLKAIFLQYLCILILGLFFAFGIPYALFAIGTGTSSFTNANYSEIAAKDAQPIIAAARKFNKDIIPSNCRYAFLNKNFAVMQSDMNETDLKDAILYAEGKYTFNDPAKGHVFITRDDGYCILQYYIGSRYTADWMNRCFPNPEMLCIILIIFNSLLACLITTTSFAKRLKKQLLPLMDATQKIKEQNLEFEIQPSKIKEFNDVLSSLADMKSELKNSLEHEWHMEQSRKEQISALAHDIKTPLTVIRGNAELLYDSKQTDEQQEYTRYIIKNSRQMQQYIQTLIEISQAETGYSIHMSKVNRDEFMKEIKYQINGLAATKKLQVEFTQKYLPLQFVMDQSLIQRAVMNVVSNAVDYSPEHSKLYFSAGASEDYIRFCITDSGKGFSPEDLKQASRQFYMGDTSRSSKSHYGIGLYISKSITEQHKGGIDIANSKATGGAQVTIEIPNNTCQMVT